MRVFASLLGLAIVVLGVGVSVHELQVKHTSHAIEALGLGVVLAGLAVIALADVFSTARRR